MRLSDIGRAPPLHSRECKNHCPATHRHSCLLADEHALFDPQFSVYPQTLLSADHIVIATGGRPRYPTEVSGLLWPLPGPSTLSRCDFPVPFPGLPESTLLKWIFRFHPFPRPASWQCLRVTPHCSLLGPVSLHPSVLPLLPLSV